MECIICKDSGSEPLQDNIYCTCKYKFHSSCWIDYVNSKNNITCLLCRKDISTNSIQRPLPTILTPLILATAPPYTIEDITSDQQITYQEFVDTIQQYNSNTTIEVRPSIQPQPLPPNQATKGEKIIKMIVCFGILVAVIILICIFA